MEEGGSAAGGDVVVNGNAVAGNIRWRKRPFFDKYGLASSDRGVRGCAVEGTRFLFLSNVLIGAQFRQVVDGMKVRYLQYDACQFVTELDEQLLHTL